MLLYTCILLASKLYNISRISKTIGLASNILNLLKCGIALRCFRIIELFRIASDLLGGRKQATGLLDGKVSAKPDNGGHPEQGTGCCQGDGGVGDCECLKLYHILHLFQIYMVNFNQFAIIFIVGQRHHLETQPS